MTRVMPHGFYARDVVEVARDLLGKHLRQGRVLLRITEVEAYRWPDDTACHARSGLTERNAPLWGPAGRAYVYQCYGIHQMLNVVTGAAGKPAAVLIRSCEPVEGLDLIRRRRGGKRGPVLLSGPGKVGQALGLNTSWSDHVLFRAGGLTVRAGDPVRDALVGVRVGVDYALPEHRDLPWRFAATDTPWVSHRRGLRPLRGRPRAAW